MNGGEIILGLGNLQAWEWRGAENQTVGDLQNFARVAKFPLKMLLELPASRFLTQHCKNNTRKSNKERENEMKNEMKKIFK